MGSIQAVASYQATDQTGSYSKPLIRVLHFISEPRSWHFFDGQPQFLGKNGFEFIAVSSPGPLLDRFAETNGVSSYSVPIVRNISPVRDVVTVVRLLKVLRKVRPQILHAHFSKPGIAGMVAGSLARVPVRIYHNHGMALSSARGWKRFLLWAVERVSCALAHRVIFVAPSVLDDAVRKRVCPAAKAVSILSANGLDIAGRFNRKLHGAQCRIEQRQSFNIPPDAFVVGFVGRILKIKGIDELVRAWQLLEREEPRLHLLLVGAYDPRAPISAWAEEVIHTESRIHLAGFMQEPATAYTAMDVVALPSYHEGLGYSLVEAAAMEIPVIGTRIPGEVDALVEGVNGLLVEPGNPEQLAAAIRTYLQNPAIAQAHGKSGREFVKAQFQRPVVWDRIRGEYQRLLATRLHGRRFA